MTRGVFVALVVGCGATAALADEQPQRAGDTTATPGSSGASESARTSGPASFDFAVPARRGGGMTIYRFNRATLRLVVLDRLTGAEAARRLVSFKRVHGPGDAIIVLSPEGPKKPPSPPPGGGDPTRWKVPEKEFQAAMEQLKTQENNAEEISIGQLAPASAPAK